MKFLKIISVLLISVSIQFAVSIDDAKSQFENGQFDSAYSSIKNYLYRNDSDPLGFV